MRRHADVLVAAAAGVVFGIGLVVSGMTRTDKVVAFLDVGGAWDPSLALVMASAVGVMAGAWAIQRRQAGPWLGGTWAVPTRRDIDARLVGGAALFGVGWGLSGFCPAPAIVAFGALSPAAVWFVPAVLVGMRVHRLVFEPRPSVAVSSAAT